MEGQSVLLSSSQQRSSVVERSRSAERYSDRDDRSRSASPSLRSHHQSNLLQPQVQLLFSDASYAPPSFNGSPNQDAERWLRRFKHYVNFRQLSDDAAIQLFKLLLTDAAADWLESVPQMDQATINVLYKTFLERFATSEILRWKQASAIFVRQQGATELVDTYITDMMNLAKRVPITDKTVIRYALIKGLKPSIRQYVLQTSPTTLEDTMKAARVAEAATIDVSTDSPEVTSLAKDVRDLMAAFKTLQDKTRQPTPERIASLDGRNNQRYQSPTPRRVTFEEDRQIQDRFEPRRTPSPQIRRPVTNTPQDWSWPDPQPSTQWSGRQSQVDFRPSAPPFGRSQQDGRRRFERRPSQQPSWQPRTAPENFSPGKQYQFSPPRCRNCGTSHPPTPDACFAKGLTCFGCGRMGHIRKMCRSTMTNSSQFRGQYIPQQ
jgi:hypothetical protein